MKNFLLLLFMLGFAAGGVHAQVTIKANSKFAVAPGTTIGSNTGFRSANNTIDLSNASLTLSGSTPWLLSNTGSGVFKIGDLTLDGTSDYTVSGQWTIMNSLNLIHGKLIIDPASANTSKLLYEGAADITGGNANSFVIGPFFSHGLGVRTFPVGTSDGYFPVQLNDVKDDAELGFEVITGVADMDISQLAEVQELFTDHYWQFTIGAGTYTGSIISLSNNLTEAFMLAGRSGSRTILESNANRVVTDLGGEPGIEFTRSSTANSANGDQYTFGKVEGVSVTISEVLTPNGDGKNNVLKISNIELYPDNKVTLLDRYGVEVHKWTGFKNYTTVDAVQDFDFTSLAIGNYICVVEYTDPRTGSERVTQMISVLK